MNIPSDSVPPAFTRRDFLGAAALEFQAGQTRPSILILMCDQLNASVLGCYGGPVPTPNIDRLASQGAVFTEAMCTTPFCSPSRASILTGLYPHQHGIVYNVDRRDYPAIPAPPTEEGITVGDITTEKLLNEAGYETHQYGKWHLAGDDLPYFPDMYGEHREYEREMAEVFSRVRQRPRDTWLNWYGWSLPVAVAPAYREAARNIDCRGDARLEEASAKAGRLELPLGQVFDVRVADRTIERLRSVGRRPFMITCSLNYPHDPYVTPSPYYEAADPAKIAFPANFHRREPRFENDWARRVIKGAGEAGARELLRVYYGSVRLVDDQVGRVLDALEKSGRSNDTIVLFTADHGDLAGGHGMMWKGTEAFYDELVRIPLIIRYPGRIRPGRMGLAASHVDFMPTLLELAGRPVSSGVQGHSLAPYLLGRKGPDKAPPYRFCERVGANRQKTRQVAPGASGAFALRGRGWKYFRLRDGSEFLYDLTRDRLETENLANVASFAGRKKELAHELESWLAETGFPRQRS